MIWKKGYLVHLQSNIYKDEKFSKPKIGRQWENFKKLLFLRRTADF